MKPAMQLYTGTDGETGDCYRASLASILDLAVGDVPHFGFDDPPASEFQERVDAWMAKQGLVQIWNLFEGVSLDDVLKTCGLINAGVCHLVIGRSPRGLNHVCVACDGDIAHDPSPLGGGLVGPADDGRYWVVWIGSLRAKA